MRSRRGVSRSRKLPVNSVAGGNTTRIESVMPEVETVWRARDGSAFNRAFCSWRPELSSQHLHWTAHYHPQFQSHGLCLLLLTSESTCIHTAYKHTHKQKHKRSKVGEVAKAIGCTKSEEKGKTLKRKINNAWLSHTRPWIHSPEPPKETKYNIISIPGTPIWKTGSWSEDVTRFAIWL